MVRSQKFVIGMGAVLALAGVYFVAMGAPIVEVERGWTQVIAGATFIGAGVVTIAIGALIGAVSQLGVAADVVSPVRPDEVEFRPDKGDAPPEVVAGAGEAAKPDEDERPGAWIDEALAERTAKLSVDDEPSAAERVPPRSTASGEKVVARYALSGVDYTLYANGVIEGLGPDGPMRFTSIEQLRAHLARGGRELPDAS